MVNIYTTRPRRSIFLKGRATRLGGFFLEVLHTQRSLVVPGLRRGGFPDVALRATQNRKKKKRRKEQKKEEKSRKKTSKNQAINKEEKREGTVNLIDKHNRLKGSGRFHRSVKKNAPTSA